jgi:sulfide:quinone oxidoreductase
MEPRKITRDLIVSGQVDPSEVADIAASGIRTIICNRPDGEAPDQAPFSAVAQAAAAAGIEAIYQPVVSSAIGDAEVDAFGNALENLPKPILAYCRSGTRCAVLWSLSEAGKMPVQSILSQAMNAGYDLSPMASRIEARKPR